MFFLCQDRRKPLLPRTTIFAKGERNHTGRGFYDVRDLSPQSKCRDRLPVFKARKRRLVEVCKKYSPKYPGEKKPSRIYKEVF